MKKFEGTFSDFLVEYQNPNKDGKENIDDARSKARQNPNRVAATQAAEAKAEATVAQEKARSEKSPLAAAQARRAKLMTLVANEDKKIAIMSRGK